MLSWHVQMRRHGVRSARAGHGRGRVVRGQGGGGNRAALHVQLLQVARLEGRQQVGRDTGMGRQQPLLLLLVLLMLLVLALRVSRSLPMLLLLLLQAAVVVDVALRDGG